MSIAFSQFFLFKDGFKLVSRRSCARAVLKCFRASEQITFFPLPLLTNIALYNQATYTFLDSMKYLATLDPNELIDDQLRNVIVTCP